MTAILILLCLAIAGRELYLSFDRKRTGTAPAPEIADIRTQLTALKGTREELEEFRGVQREQLERLAAGQVTHAESLQETDARIRSLISQINDRMLPEINDRLTQQRDSVDRLAEEVARLRGHLIGRLDQAVAASLGAGPIDTVAGGLGTEGAEAPSGLIRAYERFAERYGLRVELSDPTGEDTSWKARYYLSGRSPRDLERDFIDLVRRLRASSGTPNGTETEAANALLRSLHGIEMGGAQVGPFVLVRTPEAMLCGVLSLAELRKAGPARLLADPVGAAVRLHGLPESRFCDLSAFNGSERSR
ncbi:hypothetical protein [Actinomadura rudentiformis]|uniref:Uncharacterized protein n=1 Tax=Actinomadura rudentiformis TaxID=359158 RepID=A0A6H9YSG3_9ACTN|nr:hypothetical protein [Actinomadura rudentiformis]KAB2350966.1 hypothetical protein F8566_08430 [Actinomadura rudentiformis]